MAADLTRSDPDRAESVWDHVKKRKATDPHYLDGRDRFAPDLCYRLSQTDAARALRLARSIEAPFWKVRALAAVASAIEGEGAKKLLEEAVADPDLAKTQVEVRPTDSPINAAISLAWLLPIVEEIDPIMARELLWRGLSCRPLEPGWTQLDDERLLGDVALAPMIARYDPQIARALLEPATERLAELAVTDGGLWQNARNVLTAAAYIDPEWAIDLLDDLPDPPDLAILYPKNNARLRLVSVLSVERSHYWRYAGFWEPSDFFSH